MSEECDDMEVVALIVVNIVRWTGVVVIAALFIVPVVLCAITKPGNDDINSGL